MPIKIADCLLVIIGLLTPASVTGFEDGLLENLRELPTLMQRVAGVAETFHSNQSLQTSEEISIEGYQCLKDIYTVINGLGHAQMWAVRMFDSSSKIQSGIVEGNFVDLGQFDECVEVEGPGFFGQHCLVTLSILSNGSSPLSQIPSLTFSYCLPSSCSIEMINYLLEKATKPVQKVPGASLAFRVNDHDCHTNNKPPLDTTDWIMIVICCLLGTMALLATSLDYFHVSGKEEVTKSETIILSFSLYTNGKKLFNTKSREDEMTAINGIKFLSMCWVILCHRYGYYLQAPMVNPARVFDILKDWTKQFIINGTLSVDSFFVISGLLNAYAFFIVVSKKRSYSILDLLISYLHRFIRLTPPYMVMVGVTATFLYRLGDGPLWDRINLPPKESCQQHWWQDLLYVADYKPTMCVDQSWYLGADMQMFWLSPILLYPMWRWPSFGKICYWILLPASIAIPFAISYCYGVTVPLPVIPGSKSNPNTSQIIYLPMHARLSTYIIGIMAGYILFKVRSGQMVFRPLRVVTFLCWMIAGVCLLYPIYGGYWFYQLDAPYGQLSDSFFIALFRPMWGIGVAWTIVACVTGHGGIINSILSLKVFGPLGRLTYCAYLTHLAVIRVGIGLQRVVPHFDDYSMVQGFFGDLFYALCTATALSLLTEAPTMALEKILLGRIIKRPKREEKPAWA